MNFCFYLFLYLYVSLSFLNLKNNFNRVAGVSHMLDYDVQLARCTSCGDNSRRQIWSLWDSLFNIENINCIGA